MKGFKPMHSGMKSGFHFPSHFGFTGSTGKMTHVGGYTRKKFAHGGKVSHEDYKDNEIGDQGHAGEPRGAPANEMDAKTGGKTPLRRGFAKGGKWIAGAIKHPGALHKALHVPQGQKIPAAKLAKAAHSSNPTMRRRANLAKTLKGMHKGIGGHVGGGKHPGYAHGGEVHHHHAHGGPMEIHHHHAKGGIMEVHHHAHGGLIGKHPNYAKGGMFPGNPHGMPIIRKVAQEEIGRHVRYPAPKGHKGLGRMMAR